MLINSLNFISAFLYNEDDKESFTWERTNLKAEDVSGVEISKKDLGRLANLPTSLTD